MARYELKIEEKKKEPETEPAKVSIKIDDSGDILVHIDSSLVAWLDITGCLWLNTSWSDSEIKRLQDKGIKFEYNHIALGNGKLSLYPEN